MRSRKLLISLLLGLGFTLTVLGILAVGPLPVAHAATVTVTTTADENGRMQNFGE